MKPALKIAFLHFAEPYHCYHAAPMASAMARLPGCEVVEFVNYRACLPHLTHIRKRLGAPGLPQHTFRKSWYCRGLEKAHLLDAQRLQLLRENVAQLQEFDAVVATEYTAALLKKAGLRAKLVYLSHGAGDRKVGDEALIRHFDLALLPGPKMADYLHGQGWLSRKQIRTVGAPKLDLLPAIPGKAAPFGTQPYVLYNPHYKNSLNGWKRLLPQVVEAFRSRQGTGSDAGLGLMVAPHVKLFHEGWGATARWLQSFAGGNIRVDTGSMAMQDLSYTATASLYLGDISSQVYEFLVRPRPCVFLNPLRLDWRGNPYFRHWTLGDVVEDPADLMEAIRAAPERHALYLQAQQTLLHETYTLPSETMTAPGSGEQTAGLCNAHALRDWLLEQG
ncbi:hypothetical protein [Oecophyllibacter saccharovorans]|uniref:hypothetical protein n=1 Tax=Oecophyllibacter saccharovorans TaxID=2558360 RepID=UPI001173BFA6|nr:hypothetical protein [Oecophyllibacter saccharovorans]TPW33716.1 hypothetical protein E3203_07890 [Oecophyllibacter saccharovorans]